MSAFELAVELGAAAGHIRAARCVAAVSFLSLLLALTFGLLRAKKQLLQDAADAALEADFVRLERELATEDAATPALREEAE